MQPAGQGGDDSLDGAVQHGVLSVEAEPDVAFTPGAEAQPRRHPYPGIVLEGLIGDQPKSDLIPKIVRGLLAHRKKGRWSNTQENAWVLLALDRYFNTYEGVEPDFVASVWLGKGFAGEHQFKGRTTERHGIDIPMRIVAQTTEPQKLTIAKKGPGRMYYRVGMRYAPKSLKLDPADHGFTVERTYEAVDDPGDVQPSRWTWAGSRSQA